MNTKKPLYGATCEGGAPKDDARARRTRLSLKKAILSLAAQRDVADLSVSELSRLVHINRATFYAHAESPITLLVKVLSDELTALHERNIALLKLDGFLSQANARRTMEEIVDHVLAHEAIYANHPTSSLLLRVVLVDHVEQSVLRLFNEGYCVPPLPGPAASRLFSGFIAHGVIGAVEAWLKLPPPRDRQLLIAAIEAVYPHWYAPENRQPLPVVDASNNDAVSKSNSR